MSKYDDRTIRNFEKYLQLQKSGEMNMVPSQVQGRLGIDKEEHLFILNNYDALLEEYNSMKVVDEVLEDAKSRANGNHSKEQTKGFNKSAPKPELNN